MPRGHRGTDPEDPGFSFAQFSTVQALITGTGFAGAFGNIPAAIVFAVEADAQWPCPRSGTLWQLRAHVNPVPVGNFVSTGTVQRNGIPTPLRLVFNSANGANPTELVTQVTVAEGDLISFGLVTVVGTGTSFNFMNVSLSLG